MKRGDVGRLLKEHQRWLQILLAVAVGAAVVGYFTGIRGSPDPGGFHIGERAGPEGEHAVAPTHAELAAQRHGESRMRHGALLAAMREQRPDPYEATAATEEDKLAALEERTERRAYPGAPPVVPHPVDARQTQQCPACHWEGLEVADHVAPMAPHEPHPSCTQCHVVSDGPVPSEAPLAGGPPHEDNGFAALAAPTEGRTAWEEAPPTIPHSTHMRSRCESCHGVWATGIRTSHPWRRSCTQCHVPSAVLDQRPSGFAAPPIPLADAEEP